jgi:hypothetical protein
VLVASAVPLPDLLSAASLLLAVVAVLFGLWYPAVANSLEIESNMPLTWEDGRRPRERLHDVKVTRAIPLAAAAGIVALIFLPESIRIVARSVLDFFRHGVFAFGDYDAVATSLVVVVVFGAVLAIYLLALVIRLSALERRLDQLPKVG